MPPPIDISATPYSPDLSQFESEVELPSEDPSILEPLWAKATTLANEVSDRVDSIKNEFQITHAALQEVVASKAQAVEGECEGSYRAAMESGASLPLRTALNVGSAVCSSASMAAVATITGGSELLLSPMAVAEGMNEAWMRAAARYVFAGGAEERLHEVTKNVTTLALAGALPRRAGAPGLPELFYKPVVGELVPQGMLSAIKQFGESSLGWPGADYLDVRAGRPSLSATGGLGLARIDFGNAGAGFWGAAEAPVAVWKGEFGASAVGDVTQPQASGITNEWQHFASADESALPSWATPDPRAEFQRALSEADEDALAAVRPQLKNYLNQVSRSNRELLQALADGRSVADFAEGKNISVAQVSSMRSAALKELRNLRGSKEDADLSLKFIIDNGTDEQKAQRLMEIQPDLERASGDLRLMIEGLFAGKSVRELRDEPALQAKKRDVTKAGALKEFDQLVATRGQPEPAAAPDPGVAATVPSDPRLVVQRALLAGDKQDLTAELPLLGNYLNQVSRGHRDLLVEMIGGKTVEELAQERGVAVATIRSLRSYALKELRNIARPKTDSELSLKFIIDNGTPEQKAQRLQEIQEPLTDLRADARNTLIGLLGGKTMTKLTEESGQPASSRMVTKASALAAFDALMRSRQ